MGRCLLRFRGFPIILLFCFGSTFSHADGFHVGILAGAGSTTSFFNSGTISDGVTSPSTFQSSANYSNGNTLGIEIRYSNKNSWGFVAGYLSNSESSRRELVLVDKKSGTSVPQALDPIGVDSKIQAKYGYAGGIYRFENFYVSFAFSFPNYTIKPASTFTGVLSKTDASGVYFGTGWQFNDHISIEYLAIDGVMGLRTTGGSTKVDYGIGIFGNNLLSLKVFF